MIMKLNHSQEIAQTEQGAYSRTPRKRGISRGYLDALELHPLGRHVSGFLHEATMGAL